MKHLLNISVNITSDLTTDNYRGEGRWEMNTLNAFLSNNKPVHTTRKIWVSSVPRPANLYDGTNEEWIPESVLFVHSAGVSLYVEREDVRAFILQFHETPYGKAKDDFTRYLGQKRIVATVASRNSYIYNKLAGPFGSDNVYHVAGAMVPYVVDGADNFRKPNVTWTYRNFKSFIEEQPNDVGNLLGFLEQYLQKEPEMRIAIIIGLWDTNQFGVKPETETMRNWALSFPVMNRFKHLHNRIDFYVNLPWHDVLDLLSETRWVVSPAEPLGCPAYEAAMFGIPTIVNRGISPFVDFNGGTLFPEVLTSERNINSHFLNILDRLQNDHTFYRRTGDVYRNYTRTNATFEAFVKQIDGIITSRGWDR